MHWLMGIQKHGYKTNISLELKLDKEHLVNSRLSQVLAF